MCVCVGRGGGGERTLFYIYIYIFIYLYIQTLGEDFVFHIIQKADREKVMTLSPRYYDVTNPATMTSLTPLLRRYHPATTMSLTPQL